MGFKQRKTKLIILTLAIIVTAFNGYSQRIVPMSGSPLKDITGDYRLRLPASYKDIQDLQIAVIPLDSIGKKSIKWNSNQQQLSIESETEFERSLLLCNENIILDKEKDSVKTKREKSYCRRRGYTDGGMGRWYEVNYISFKKNNHLVIVEFGVVWTNCRHGHEDRDDLIKECQKEEENKKDKIDAFVDEVVNKISFHKIGHK